MAKKYYELLGVSEDASQEEIKKSYRKKAKKYHPDSNSETADEEKFKKINKAYDVLGDEEKRKKYDRFGEQAVNGQASGGRRRAASDFQDLFEQIFGGGRRSRRNSRGEDLKVQTTISLEEAYSGVEKTFDVSRKKECPDCEGTGAEGSETKTCPECDGEGRVRQVRRTPLGRAQTVEECANCHGRGEVPEIECDNCSGKGVTEQSDRITVDIPSGVKDGQRLRLENQGSESPNGQAGDLYIYVSVKDHQAIERRENDLFTTVKIGVGDAALGCEVTVEHPESDIQVDIPAGTQPGQVLRLKGKGMPSGFRSGDFYIKVDVEIPEDLDEEQKDVMEDLRKKPERDKSFFESVKEFI